MGRIVAEHIVQSSKVPYKVSVGEQILSSVSETDVYRNADRVAVVISKNVHNRHREYLDKFFPPSDHLQILLEDGENTKEFVRLEKLMSDLLLGGCSRQSCIVAIGGGVVGDFAGLASALFMRGIPVIQVPTTLLAMVDSSIGGKTAVNIGAGKNIAGAFYPPSAVIQDISFLSTLDDSEFRNGLSESVKHACIGQKDLMALFESSTLSDLRDTDALASHVALSSGFKVGVVSRDEREQGERAILNFGHTIGHAIESSMKYGIPHGEAVAIGMEIVSHISERLGLLSKPERERISHVIRSFSLFTNRRIPEPSVLAEHMKFDKKNSAGVVRFVLLEGLFRPIYNVSVDMALVSEEISRFMERT